METKVRKQEPDTRVEGDVNNSAESQPAGSSQLSGQPSAPPANEASKTELPADLGSAYQKVQAEKQDLYDRLLRKQAEFENFRKRTQHEKEEFLQHANAELIRSLLPALDAFERALKHRDPRVPAPFYQGMELTHRQLLDVLGRAGLTPLEVEGKDFDPHLHQAVETVELERVRDHEVVEEVQRGYKFKHRLLRPAMVKVAVRPGRPMAGGGTRDDGKAPSRGTSAPEGALQKGDSSGEQD